MNIQILLVFQMIQVNIIIINIKRLFKLVSCLHITLLSAGNNLGKRSNLPGVYYELERELTVNVLLIVTNKTSLIRDEG